MDFIANTMTRPQAAQFLDSFARGKEEQLRKDWLLRARREQWLPDGDWQAWLILAGRGFGKTRAGAEAVRHWIQSYNHVNLIGATADDARDIMVEGESGILAVCTKAERPEYIANKNLLRWPNGARSLIFTADKPERLRGKQSSKLWLDEVAAWRYPASYDQAMLGLRLGDSPQAVITTTPRPIKIIKSLISDSTTVITRGSTYDNQRNLAAAFISKIIKKYEGTRLGRQELFAEVLDDNPNSLFKRSNIDANRVYVTPEMQRVCIGVDPAVSNSESSNRTGIVGVGRGMDNRGYVMADVSVKGTPEEWARAAVKLYHELKANFIVAEVNNGGDLVAAMIKTIDKTVPVISVHASRGKAKRAEPISSLYEQGRISHIGCFNELEDECCEFDPTLPPDPENSPDRMDAMVWAFSKIMLPEAKPFLVG